MKKYHYIYKITRFDGKYYIGLHSSNSLNDSYYGSGTLIRNSIKKYGKENHNKEIIEILPNRDLLILKEIELVTIELIKDPLCMNLRVGGTNITDDEILKLANRGKGVKKSEEHKNNIKQSMKGKGKGVKKSEEQKRQISQTLQGVKKSEEVKQKMKISHNGKGENNSSFNTIWINDGIKEKRINKEEEIPDGFIVGKIFTRKDTKWINNGINNKMIGIFEDIPIGWKLGRFSKNKLGRKSKNS